MFQRRNSHQEAAAKDAKLVEMQCACTGRNSRATMKRYRGCRLNIAVSILYNIYFNTFLANKHNTELYNCVHTSHTIKCECYLLQTLSGDEVIIKVDREDAQPALET